MGRERDTKSGKFTTAYPREDFVAALEQAGFLSTSEVADHVGCTQNLAYRRLKALEEEGVVTSQKVGRSLAWQNVD